MSLPTKEILVDHHITDAKPSFASREGEPSSLLFQPTSKHQHRLCSTDIPSPLEREGSLLASEEEKQLQSQVSLPRSSSTSQIQTLDELATPSSQVEPYMVCNACSGLSLQSLALERGYYHLPSAKALAKSSKTCGLCELIWQARDFCVEGKRPNKGSQLICTLSTINNTAMMTTRSREYHFRSSVPFFLQEG